MHEPQNHNIYIYIYIYIYMKGITCSDLTIKTMDKVPDDQEIKLDFYYIHMLGLMIA